MLTRSRFILWALLLCMNVLSIAAVLPYIFTLQKELIETLPLSIPLFFVLQLIQGAFTFGILIALGLFFARKMNLGMPALEAISSGTFRSGFSPSAVGRYVFYGALAAIVILATDMIFAALGTPLAGETISAPLWQRFLASFYGGIAEETLMRLFLMSLIAWAGSWLTGKKGGIPSVHIYWSAIVIAAVIFGLGHLPITAALTAITPLIIIRAILLNGIGGVLFGWLFWRKGLESAMIAHFSADIMLLIVLPSLISMF